MPNVSDLPRVLFVDDEENLLNGLSRQVRGRVDAELVISPMAAADLLDQAAAGEVPGFAVIVSDMRMPGMDGAALLQHAKRVCPDTTRLLLTGYADMDSAIAAVNQGSVFRFLTKPCATPNLHTALNDAIEQHQLVHDRRQLLELTLRGAVEALVETLAMAHPAAFARAARLGRLASDVAVRLDLPDRWQLEVAAQLGQIGAITLPPEALEALSIGMADNATIATMLAAMPSLADGVLARIPRLDPVREIVAAQQPVDQPDTGQLARAGLPARVLQAVREYDALTCRGYPPENAVGLLRQRHHHSTAVVDALQTAVSTLGTAEVQEIDVSQLRRGLVLAADLRTTKGMLLVSHGHTLTDEMLARIRNFSKLQGLAGRPMIMKSR